MKSYEQAASEDRRLVILRLLAEDRGGSHNHSVLRGGLAVWGHKVSADQVRTDLAWLHEQDLVQVEVVGGEYHVATITERGYDVSQGLADQPGVKRPRPGV